MAARQASGPSNFVSVSRYELRFSIQPKKITNKIVYAPLHRCITEPPHLGFNWRFIPKHFHENGKQMFHFFDSNHQENDHDIHKPKCDGPQSRTGNMVSFPKPVKI